MSACLSMSLAFSSFSELLLLRGGDKGVCTGCCCLVVELEFLEKSNVVVVVVEWLLVVDSAVR